LRATPLSQGDNGAAGSSAAEAGFHFGGALRHGLSRALPGQSQDQRQRRRTGVPSPVGRVGIKDGAAGVRGSHLSQKTRKMGHPLWWNCRRVAWVLRRESPALRATPLPQYDNGAAGSLALRHGLSRALPVGRVGIKDGAAGVRGSHLSQKTRKMEHPLSWNWRRVAWVLRWESPALRATPLPQDDNANQKRRRSVRPKLGWVVGVLRLRPG
jgi:hypothetical protein